MRVHEPEAEETFLRIRIPQSEDCSFTVTLFPYRSTAIVCIPSLTHYSHPNRETQKKQEERREGEKEKEKEKEKERKRGREEERKRGREEERKRGREEEDTNNTDCNFILSCVLSHSFIKTH